MGQYGMKVGTPGVRSVGPIAFGPGNVLFVADNVSATVFAVDVADQAGPAGTGPFDLKNLDAKLCGRLGCDREDLTIRDMAVHPVTGAVYLAVVQGASNAAVPLIVRLDRAGALADVPLRDIAYAQVSISKAPAEDDERVIFQFVEDTGARGSEPDEIEVFGRTLPAVVPGPSGLRWRIRQDKLRAVTVTDMAYVDGLLLVAGMSNEEFSSTFRRIPFPFQDETVASPLEIFHVSHGQYETAAPIRAFVPYGDGASVLASYGCTPLVQFSLADLANGAPARGKTVAELGPNNQPLDMVSFTRDGEEFLLVSNNFLPLLKIAGRDIDGQGALTEPTEPRGVPVQALDHQGVVRLANLDDAHVLMMQKDEAGVAHLRSYATASL